MRHWNRFRNLTLLLLLASVGLTGCKYGYPHSFTLPRGHIERSHAKPIEGGYYKDWDPYSATLEVTPEHEVNPVGTQHVFVATVRDKEGNPLPNRRVEWMIAKGSVGDFVEVDESGFTPWRGYKVTNDYAVSHTNNCAHVLTRGTDDPSDDVHLKAGDTWAVVTSPVEGTTHVIAYAPGIYDWEDHKVFVTKLWQDVRWVFPADATNPIGTSHTFTTQVFKASDGTPHQGYIVTYNLVGGPAGTFQESGSTNATVETDASGIASVTLVQTSPAEGTNEVQIAIDRTGDNQCCEPDAHIADGMVYKTWVGPEIGITKTATPSALVNEEFDYDITVNNPSPVDATSVVVTDTLPDGIQYSSSSPSAEVSGQSLTWSLGTVAAGSSTSINVRVSGDRTGRFTNCAQVTADYGLSDEDCADTVIAAPELELVKECVANAMLCDPIPYTLTVRNTGDGVARNVRVSESLPEGLVTTDGQRSLVFEAGDLGPGEARRADYTVRAERTGTFTNTATAAGDGDLSAEASCTTTVTEAVLTVTKTAPDVRFIGRPADYEITVTNDGDAVAENVALTDTIPAGTTVQQVGDGGQVQGQMINWNLGNLNAGQSRTVTLTLVMNQIGSVRNTATARARCAEASDEAVVDVRGRAAILLEVIDISDPIEVGGQEVYEIRVTNQGSAVGTNIQITATVPDAHAFVEADGPTNAQVAGKVITYDPLPSLAPKASVTYRVVTRAEAPADARFAVQLISDQMETPVDETESTHSY